ncbi:hypothetical protein ACFE04_027980 [Oxalis oulophora]
MTVATDEEDDYGGGGTLPEEDQDSSSLRSNHPRELRPTPSEMGCKQTTGHVVRDSMSKILERYHRCHYNLEDNKMDITQSVGLYQEVSRLKAKYESLLCSQRNMLGEDLGPLNMKQLEKIEKQLDKTLLQARHRKAELMLNRVEELRKKEQDLIEENGKLKSKLQWEVAGDPTSIPCNNLLKVSSDMNYLNLCDSEKLPFIAERSQDMNSLVVCFGEMLIDFVPTVSGVSLAEAPAFKKAPGGAPANVAVGITRLGGKSAFIGKVGEDDFGKMLSDILKQNNVDNSGVRFDHNARTALAFVTLRADGEREFLFFRHPSADMLLQESELDTDLIKRGKIFHYGSISLIAEPCRSTHLAAMKIAKSSGSLLSYDPNLRLPLWPSEEAAREEIMSIWDQADIIKISEDEITFLTGGDDPYDDNVVLTKLFHPNLTLLIVTEGSAGCRYYTKDFKGRVTGCKVKAVDTTGAGDAFVGGLLYCLASDQSIMQDENRLREALHFANACGALTVMERGAIPALPTKQAVLEFLANVTE